MTETTDPHLSETDIARHFLQDATGQTRERINRHLRACPACRDRLGDFYRSVELFPAGAWAQRRRACRASLRRLLALLSTSSPEKAGRPRRPGNVRGLEVLGGDFAAGLARLKVAVQEAVWRAAPAARGG